MRRKTLIQSFTAVAAAVALAIAGAWVHYRTMDRAEARLNGSKVELRQLELDNARLRNALASLPELEAAVARFRARMPAQPELGGVLESLSATLARAKVREQEILTRQTVSGRDFLRVPVALHFKASLDSAYDVVRHLETLPRNVRVEKLRIERSADRDVPQVEIEFSAFASEMEELWPR